MEEVVECVCALHGVHCVDTYIHVMYVFMRGRWVNEGGD